MAPTVRGGPVGNIKQLRRSLKKKSNNTFMTRVPSEGSLLVRFLTEPQEGWQRFFEHYDDIRKFYPCSDDCPGCMEGNRPSERYLANVLLVDDNTVVPLLMPKTLAAQVMKAYDKYNTLLDRDYDLSRTGQGFDTEYSALPETPTKRNLARYDLIDLQEVLQSQLGVDVEDEDDDEDDDIAPAPSRVRAVKRPTIVDEDDEDEDEDDEDVAPPRPARKVLVRKSAAPRKIVRRK